MDQKDHIILQLSGMIVGFGQLSGTHTQAVLLPYKDHLLHKWAHTPDIAFGEWEMRGVLD